MADTICDKNLARYKVGHFLEDDTPFCLSQVSSYEAEDPTTQQQIEDLLEGRAVRKSPTAIERACNIGGCTLKITEDLQQGRKITGQCKAASYCLKTAFEAVGQAPTVEAGRALYKEIIDTLEHHADKYSAGNYCPRLNCDLSAGVSIDMNPGTAGECAVERSSNQQQIDFSAPLI